MDILEKDVAEFMGIVAQASNSLASLECARAAQSLRTRLASSPKEISDDKDARRLLSLLDATAVFVSAVHRVVVIEA